MEICVFFTVVLSYTQGVFLGSRYTHLHINTSNLTSTRSTITIPIINMKHTKPLLCIWFKPGDGSVCACLFRSLYPLWKYIYDWNCILYGLKPMTTHVQYKCLAHRPLPHLSLVNHLYDKMIFMIKFILHNISLFTVMAGKWWACHLARPPHTPRMQAGRT